jgi:hypothetical protein
MANVRTVTMPLMGTAASGILAAGTVAFHRVPSGGAGGAITVIEAMIVAKSGTVTCQLVDLGPAGTATAGTVCALALAAAANVPVGTVLATPYVLDPGDYFGLEIGVGTVIYPANVSVSYIVGK